MDTLPALFGERRPLPESTLLAVPGGEVLTYGDADRRSGQLANWLYAQGARRGDRVAMQIEKSPLAVLVYLACLRAGFVFLPMNTAYTDDEVAYLLDDAEPAVVVRDPTDALVAEANQMPASFEDLTV